ncbi:unnamed protein product [Arctogadus glacialis]
MNGVQIHLTGSREVSVWSVPSGPRGALSLPEVGALSTSSQAGPPQTTWGGARPRPVHLGGARPRPVHLGAPGPEYCTWGIQAGVEGGAGVKATA